MKQKFAYISVFTLVVMLLASPLATCAVALEPTTTVPYTTTTTTWVYDCISTTLPTTTTQTTLHLTGPDGTNPDCNTTFPTTTATTTLPTTTFPTTMTSTTLNLTGPDGTNPDYNTTFPTTTSSTTAEDDLPPTTHPVTLDLLSTASFYENGTISILANPNYGGEWMSADCYTYDGASVSIVSENGGPWDIRVLRYLHITVTANVPFMVKATDASTDIFSSSGHWIAQAIGAELVDGWIPKGEYVGVVDLYEAYSNLTAEPAGIVDLVAFEVYMSKPGSITVGHIALSPDAVCTKTAPKIQTTTIPKFPTTGTTDTTLPIDTTTSTTTTTTVITYATTTDTTVADTTFPPTTTTTAPVPTGGGTTQLTSTVPSGDITSTTQSTSVQRGDLNGDDIVNMWDAIYLYNACTGDNENGFDLSPHDLNSDGVINMFDCLILYNHIGCGGEL